MSIEKVSFEYTNSHKQGISGPGTCINRARKPGPKTVDKRKWVLEIKSNCRK
jgi:hypothetical protein